MFGRRNQQEQSQQQTPFVSLPHTYQMRERLIAFGDDYDIRDDHGNRVFHIDGKALRVRDTLIFEDTHGQELYTIQARVVRMRESMAIERSGQQVAEVHKAVAAPLRERLEVDVTGGQSLTVQGNLLDHEYAITRDGRLPIASISKKWFHVRDTYGVEVLPGQDDALLLAITVCVDEIVHNE